MKMIIMMGKVAEEARRTCIFLTGGLLIFFKCSCILANFTLVTRVLYPVKFNSKLLAVGLSRRRTKLMNAKKEKQWMQLPKNRPSQPTFLLLFSIFTSLDAKFSFPRLPLMKSWKRAMGPAGQKKKKGRCNRVEKDDTIKTTIYCVHCNIGKGGFPFFSSMPAS